MLFAVQSHALDSQTNSALSVLKEGIRKYTLSNGVRVLLYDRGIAPVFSGVVAVRVGGVDEPEGKTGISHMLEHMAFKGTSVFGTKDFDKERELLDQLEEVIRNSDKGQNFSPEQKERWSQLQSQLQELWTGDDFIREYRVRGAAGMNATTDKELTNYFVSFPKSAFEFWCMMESSRLVDPVLRQFYKERDVVMEERRMRYDNSPDGKLYELLLNTAYSQHPYRNPVIGYPEDIRSLTAKETAEFQKQYYVPENIVVSVVGDINPETDLPLLEKYFGRLKVAASPERTKIVEPMQQGEKRVSYKTNSSRKVFIGYKKPNYPHQDDAPLGVMLEMLVGTRSSPVYKELVQKTQIAAGLDYDESPGTAYPNLMLFYASIQAPYTNEQFLEAFDQELVKFKKAEINPELLEIAKRSIAMSYLSNLKSSMSVARDIASSELLHGGWQATFDWYEKAMAVTPEDIKRVANTYLNDTTRTVGFIEPLK